MKNLFLFCFLSVCLCACTGPKSTQSTETTPNDSTKAGGQLNISETNPIPKSKDTTVYYLDDALACKNFEGLVKKYGGNNLRKTAKIPAAEGQEVDGTLLFPDSDDELQIFWQEGKMFNEIESVISSVRFLRDDKISFYTHWKTRNNMKIGMKLSEVVTINQKDFTISGFDWDYGGNVISWEGGKLQDKGIHVRFTVPENNKLDAQEMQSISGDTEFKVSLSALKKLNPVVDEITISSPPKAVQ